MLLLLYVILFALAIYGAEINLKGFYDPFDRGVTSSIKGFFIGSVFISHLTGYIESMGYVSRGMGDYIFHCLRNIQGQLIVVMFLFYSGYGVFVAAKERGIEYVNNMPKRRILNTLLNFNVAVSFFAVVMLIRGESFSFARFIFSLFAWDSMGNSNWYIFVILVCYVVAWVVLKLCRERERIRMFGGMICCLAIIGIIILLSLAKAEWWYNTLMAFPLGGLCAEFRDDIEGYVRRNYWRCLLGASIVLCLFVGWFMKHECGIFYNFTAVVFALFVMIASMKIKVGNQVLFWMGINLFPLYIYQRMPMRLFEELFNGHMYGCGLWGYIISCLAVSSLIAVCYRYIEIKLK